MVVKPSIQWLNKDSDSELINDSNVVLKALADNATIYTTPAPTLPIVQTALTAFTNAVAATTDGGPSDTAAKNNARLVLVGLLRQLAAYVLVACKGDMAYLLLSGFPAQKPTRTTIGVLPAPQNTTLALGARTGELDAAVNPVFGASVYNWKLTSNAPGAGVQTGQSTASYFTFANLTPGVTYSITANAVGAAGAGDWSNPANQMAV
jgi:hypothetical protein